jgi:SAM-dependent methyltransferase
MKSEFDNYANDYCDLLRDPIRDFFAPNPAFFSERKWELLVGYIKEVGMLPGMAAWLDVGCGKGDFLRMGAKEFAKAAGCDLSAEMLESCGDLETVLQNEPTHLPFSSNSFDLITAVCVYHHVLPQDRPALTSEIFRVLRPGGTACIIEHNPFNPAVQLIIRRTPVDADAHLLTARTAERLLTCSGLKRKGINYFLYFPRSLYKTLSRVEAFLAKVPAGGQYAVFAQKSLLS